MPDTTKAIWMVRWPTTIDALEIDSKNWAAYFRRGVVRNRKGEKDAVLTDYSKAMEFNPRHTLAYNNRALLHADRGGDAARNRLLLYKQRKPYREP